MTHGTKAAMAAVAMVVVLGCAKDKPSPTVAATTEAIAATSPTTAVVTTTPSPAATPTTRAPGTLTLYLGLYQRRWTDEMGALLQQEADAYSHLDSDGNVPQKAIDEMTETCKRMVAALEDAPPQLTEADGYPLEVRTAWIEWREVAQNISEHCPPTSTFLLTQANLLHDRQVHLQAALGGR